MMGNQTLEASWLCDSGDVTLQLAMSIPASFPSFWTCSLGEFAKGERVEFAALCEHPSWSYRRFDEIGSSRPDADQVVRHRSFQDTLIIKREAVSPAAEMQC